VKEIDVLNKFIQWLHKIIAALVADWRKDYPPADEGMDVFLE